MTELSALAGSEGYAACDDDASVELAAFGGQPRRRAQRRSPSAARAAGGLYCQKGRRGLFDSRKTGSFSLLDVVNAVVFGVFFQQALEVFEPCGDLAGRLVYAALHLL